MALWRLSAILCHVFRAVHSFVIPIDFISQEVFQSFLVFVFSPGLDYNIELIFASKTKFNYSFCLYCSRNLFDIIRWHWNVYLISGVRNGTILWRGSKGWICFLNPNLLKSIVSQNSKTLSFYSKYFEHLLNKISFLKNFLYVHYSWPPVLHYSRFYSYLIFSRLFIPNNRVTHNCIDSCLNLCYS